jgi:hypothetical protein
MKKVAQKIGDTSVILKKLAKINSHPSAALCQKLKMHCHRVCL